MQGWRVVSNFPTGSGALGPAVDSGDADEPSPGSPRPGIICSFLSHSLVFCSDRQFHPSHHVFWGSSACQKSVCPAYPESEAKGASLSLHVAPRSHGGTITRVVSQHPPVSREYARCLFWTVRRIP